jgi:ABC-type nitrate/sulfonate/bicarbonate transport system substrate-binding protein
MTQNTIKKILYLAISLLLLVVAYFVILHTTKTVPKVVLKTKEPLTITISDVRSQAFSLLYIAAQEGYFGDENLTVNFRTFGQTPDSLQDMANGNSDLATTLEIPYLRKLATDKDLYIISSLNRSGKNTAAIVGWKSAKIEKPEDLKGKSIAVTKGTNSEFLLYTTLKRYKLKIEDVKPVFMNPSDIESAFKNNLVQAASVSNISLYNIKTQIPQQKVTIIYPDTYINNSMLVAKKETIQNKKEEIVRLLKALERAKKFANSNREKSIQDLSVALPNIATSSIKILWDSYEATLSLDNVLMEILITESQTLRDLENYDIGNIDFKEKIYSDYLSEVDKSLVKIF